MDLVVQEAVEGDCTGRLEEIGQFHGQTRHWRQLDWGCSVPQLMTVDAGGEQSIENSWACVLSQWRQGAKQGRMWLCLCHALAQPLGSGTPSQALAGWMSRSFFPSLFQTQEQLGKVWTNESLQVLDVLAAPCHPASHSVLLP